MTVSFIFLFSPNNSGTTIISQYLQSQTGGYLPPFGNNEGQMAPSVRSVMRRDPWNPSVGFDWGWIRSEWSKLALDANKSIFIECSPPNLVRAAEVRKAFGDVSTFISSISNPYSFISSVICNYHSPPITTKMVENATNQWLLRAEKLRADLLLNPMTIRTSYEEFCAAPEILNRYLGIPSREIKDLSGKSNDPIGKIVDLSLRNWAFLDFAEWGAANKLLERRDDILNFFGYGIISGSRLIEKSHSDACKFHAGILRRAQWNAKIS